MPTPKPMPKYTTPTVAQFKQSAAGKNGAMTYKEYIKVSEQVYKAKQKKK